MSTSGFRRPAKEHFIAKRGLEAAFSCRPIPYCKAQGFEGFLEIGKDGDTSVELAGEAYEDRTTIYFFPDGLIRTGHELNRRKSTRGLLTKPPKGTRILVGYVYGGHATTRRSPSAIAGVKWNYPSTFYRLPGGAIVSGDEIDPTAIPAKTLVFYQH